MIELLAILAVLAAVWLVYDHREGFAFAATTVTIASCILAIFVDLYPNVMVSSTNPAYNLTVHNTASGGYSLKVMTVVVIIFLPVVLAYQTWTYYVFRRRVSRQEFQPPARRSEPRAAAGAPGNHRQPGVPARPAAVVRASRIGYHPPGVMPGSLRRDGVVARRSVRGANMATNEVDALVIFGATGDLAKIETFPALVGLVQRGVLDVPVIGVAKSGWGLEQFRDYAAASLKLNNMDPNSAAAQKMLGLLRYVDGDLGDEATYQAMSDQIGAGAEGPVLHGGAGPAVRANRAGNRTARAARRTRG